MKAALVVVPGWLLSGCVVVLLGEREAAWLLWLAGWLVADFTTSRCMHFPVLFSRLLPFFSASKQQQQQQHPRSVSPVIMHQQQQYPRSGGSIVMTQQHSSAGSGSWGPWHMVWCSSAPSVLTGSQQDSDTIELGELSD